MQQILSILGWVGTALVFGAVAIRFTRPEWDQYATWAAWAGLALVVLYTVGQWREIVAYFRRRQARYGAIATLGVLVALAIVVALNYLAARNNKRWDFTAAQQNSLSEQTIKVLQGLQGPAKFTVFERQTEMERFRQRLNDYAYQSRQVTVEYVDPDTRPVVAKEYEIQQYGTVVVDYMGRRERTTSAEEQDLTNALIKAVSGMERAVYFTQGHGEKDPSGTERDGYSAVAEALRRDNYKVERLVLAQQKDVPADATAVIVAGPTTDLLPEEAEALRRYLAKAGKLMMLIDPPIGTQGQLPNIEALAREWGIQIGANVVVDVSGATNEPSVAVAASYPAHAITDRFATLTIYPLARAVEPVSGGAEGRTAQPIVETSPRSWAEADLSSLTGDAGVEMNEDKGDKPGPVPIAAAVSAPVEGADAAKATPPAPGQPEPPKPETRIAVFGDSDFATNAYGGVPGNPNLFANTVSWLAQQENLIAIRPVQAEDRRVTMTPGQQRLAMLTSIVLLPGLVFAAGVLTWWRRR
jgi:ABC-type uncharacterized transport system involved in gliding motility auxiliary subunit